MDLDNYYYRPRDLDLEARDPSDDVFLNQLLSREPEPQTWADPVSAPPPKREPPASKAYMPRPPRHHDTRGLEARILTELLSRGPEPIGAPPVKREDPPTKAYMPKPLAKREPPDSKGSIPRPPKTTREIQDLVARALTQLFSREPESFGAPPAKREPPASKAYMPKHIKTSREIQDLEARVLAHLLSREPEAIGVPPAKREDPPTKAYMPKPLAKREPPDSKGSIPRPPKTTREIQGLAARVLGHLFSREPEPASNPPAKPAPPKPSGTGQKPTGIDRLLP